MKKLKTLFLILLTMPIYAQWVQQNSGTSQSLNDVYCITEDVVVVVGNNGTILKTIDGGTTWLQKPSPTIYNLEKVQFASANVGYAFGIDSSRSRRIILKTSNGGENWVILLSFNSMMSNNLSVINENIFYYTNNTTLYKTVDGGTTFQTINTSESIQNIQFVDEQKGFGTGSGLFKTIDGGVSWTSIGGIDIYSESSSLAYYFFNETTGFKKYNNELLKTVDGGLNYTYLTTISFMMQKLFAPSVNIVWGVTWELSLDGQPNYTSRVEILNFNQIQRIDTNDPALKSIYFISPTIGYGVNWFGQIFKNTIGTMLDVNQIKTDKGMLLYPNPANGEVSISFNESPSESFSIEIIDSIGKKVFKEVYHNENNININTNSMSKGVYFLSVINQEKRETRKVIIN